MRLIQAKVRAVEGVEDSGWFVPGRGTTLIVGPKGCGKTELLRALEALNPVYDIDLARPFSGHPELWQQGEYSRKVIPQKKTAVFMVFSAETALILELEKIDIDLLQTDRIEIGRRLDYSRWTTFVEISASSRWSELAADMHELYNHIINTPADRLGAGQHSEFLQHLRGSDRVKDQVAEVCSNWLAEIGPHVAPEKSELYERCRYGVERFQRFREATEMVADWLPLTLYLQPAYELLAEYSFDEIYDDKWRERDQPCISLLRLLSEKFQLHSAESETVPLEHALAKMEETRQFFENIGVKLPGVTSDGQGLSLHNIESHNRLQKRFQCISMLCLLAELCSGHRPLLLLDHFDRDLSPAELAEMISWLQQLAGRYQLLATTADERVAAAAGWQAVKRLESNLPLAEW